MGKIAIHHLIESKLIRVNIGKLKKWKTVLRMELPLEFSLKYENRSVIIWCFMFSHGVGINIIINQSN